MKTIKAAIGTNPGVTPLLHSDRGFQYTLKNMFVKFQKQELTTVLITTTMSVINGI